METFCDHKFSNIGSSQMTPGDKCERNFNSLLIRAEMLQFFLINVRNFLERLIINKRKNFQRSFSS